MRVRFHEAVGATAVLVALGTVAYAAVVQGQVEALGALITVLAAGCGFFLRAKAVEKKED